MSIYRAQLPEDVVTFLLDGNDAGPGPLTNLADHVRDGNEYDQPGWTYLDNAAISTLKDLPDTHDGVVSTDSVTGDLVLSVEGTGYVLEVVQS